MTIKVHNAASYAVSVITDIDTYVVMPRAIMSLEGTQLKEPVPADIRVLDEPKPAPKSTK